MRYNEMYPVKSQVCVHLGPGFYSGPTGVNPDMLRHSLMFKYCCNIFSFNSNTQFVFLMITLVEFNSY
jgi:hypothetical protein